MLATEPVLIYTSTAVLESWVRTQRPCRHKYNVRSVCISDCQQLNLKMWVLKAVSTQPSYTSSLITDAL